MGVHINFTCSISDVDPCSGDPCHENATCTGAEGSYTCSCNDGWTGDGYTCSLIREYDMLSNFLNSVL